MPDYAARLFEICGDAKVMRFMGAGIPYEKPEQAREFLSWAANYERENGFCRWAVIEKTSGEIIGSSGFARPHGMKEVEIGYLFARAFWGKGFATEAAMACMQYGFEKLGFREIIAITDLENAASQKVLEKINFVKRGIEKIDGEDNLIYIAKNSENIQ